MGEFEILRASQSAIAAKQVRTRTSTTKKDHVSKNSLTAESR
jgi:hypothetical protein